MIGGIIRLGDTTTGGGTVITASGTGLIVDDLPTVRLGDKATCAKHGGVRTFIECCTSWIDDGLGSVIEGHKLSCGCHAISSVPDSFVIEDVSGGTASAIFQAMTSLIGSVSQPAVETAKSQTRWFLVRDSTTGEPLSNQPFVADVDGAMQHGRTDATGYAQVVAMTATSVSIHTVFAAPKRHLTPEIGT